MLFLSLLLSTLAPLLPLREGDPLEISFENRALLTKSHAQENVEILQERTPPLLEIFATLFLFGLFTFFIIEKKPALKEKVHLEPSLETLLHELDQDKNLSLNEKLFIVSSLLRRALKPFYKENPQAMTFQELLQKARAEKLLNEPLLRELEELFKSLEINLFDGKPELEKDVLQTFFETRDTLLRLKNLSPSLDEIKDSN